MASTRQQTWTTLFRAREMPPATLKTPCRHGGKSLPVPDRKKLNRKLSPTIRPACPAAKEAALIFMPDREPRSGSGGEEFISLKKKTLGEFTVHDILPMVVQTLPEKTSGSLVPRRSILPVYPSSWTSGSSESQIPWLVLFQSMEERLNQMMVILARISSGEPVRLPKPVLVEISEAGILFRSERMYPAGDVLHLLIDLPVFPPVELEARARAVGSSDRGREEEGRYEVLASFEGLPVDLRDRLLQYIVVRQREEIRHGHPDKAVATSRRIG